MSMLSRPMVKRSIRALPSLLALALDSVTVRASARRQRSWSAHLRVIVSPRRISDPFLRPEYIFWPRRTDYHQEVGPPHRQRYADRAKFPVATVESVPGLRWCVPECKVRTHTYLRSSGLEESDRRLVYPAAALA